MLEDPKTPTFLGMTGDEWHAFGYGLKDGLKIWKRTHILYSQIDQLDTSPEVKVSLKLKFHYYEIGSDLPEDIALLVCALYFGTTNLPSLMKIAGMFFGMG
jgi:hypothetical protein